MFSSKLQISVLVPAETKTKLFPEYNPLSTIIHNCLVSPKDFLKHSLSQAEKMIRTLNFKINNRVKL